MDIIKSLLKFAKQINENIEQKFEMVTTEDGKEINITSREVGAEVTEGVEATPVPDGSYSVDSGAFKFTVADGVIASIDEQVEVKPEEETGEELADEVPTEEAPKEDEAKDEKIAELEAKIKELEDKLAEAGTFSTENYATKVDLNTVDSTIKELFKAFEAKLEVLAKTPMEYSKVAPTFKEKTQKEINAERLREAMNGK